MTKREKFPKRIQKRDGRIVEFESPKITDVIFKAGQAAGEFGGKEAERLSNSVIRKIFDLGFNGKVIGVEKVQDIVEEMLMKDEHYKTAKAYILYRELHRRARDLEALVDVNKLINGYLERMDWRVRENANMAYSLQGLNIYASTAVSAKYWLNQLYDLDARQAHESGDLHIHDLYLLAPYCCGWDLKDFLLKGFGGVQGKIESRPPKHFKTALGQLVNFLYTLQGEAAGAEAISNFDTLLAPFIRFDNLNYKEVKQGLQEFLFNMNVPTRVGFQTPFTNITLDLKVPSYMQKEPVIVNGKLQESTYGEFQDEMDMFNRAFAELMMEGDASGRVFTFPIPTYNISKDFNWDNPVLDPVWEMTAKYGIPYFANFINSDMKPEDARSMCCRLRLDNRELKKRGGGYFGANPLTGSIGVVTINLPRLAYHAKNIKDFWSQLDNLMQIARRSLVTKRQILEKFTETGLYPYSQLLLFNVKERLGSYWYNHFSTIGVCGGNEAALNLLGCNLNTEEGKSFILEVLDFMNDKLRLFQAEDEQLYNLEATPAEGTAFRLAKLDKEAFPDILVANETAYREGAAPFYTNSTQLPVGFTDDLFEALELQDKLQCCYTGGTVLHSFLGERLPSGEAAKNLVRKIALNYQLPYFTLTPTFSICMEHGYLAGEHPKCPNCNRETEVYTRVVGYLRPVVQWNDGKQAEYKERKTFVL
ncbi:ribonucleoside triphosphate reductase [Patescibacteria group bacterium]|nr:ribonucleoside triphosphate reductase [Patescibacteria group bacterium]